MLSGARPVWVSPRADGTVHPDDQERVLAVVQEALEARSSYVLQNRTMRPDGLAGKGGSIRRITAALDPRRFRVHPVAAPSDEEKAQLFRTATVYVSPATGRESFGIVLLEAMAAGAPIVCSDIHGYKGVVRRGREGLLVPPREPRELAVAIDKLLRDPGLREQMGAAGQARAEEFSWPRVTAKVEDYYGFVIRRLAAAGMLPKGFRAEIPQAPPPVRARASARSPDPAEPAAALDSASASRHTEAE